MINDWTSTELGNTLTLKYGKGLHAKNRMHGSVPVYGSNGIVGWHNSPLIKKAGIIVGRKGSAGNVHYSSKPFFPIDTTFYITDEDTNLNLKFLYYFLKHLNLKRILGDVGVPGLNREMAYREIISYPTNIIEQQKIAHILSTVQRAIEQQERLIQVTTELKKALMHKLFTEGSRGEKQKETDIGLVPESWEVVEIGDIFKFSSGKTRPQNTNKEKTKSFQIPVYGGNGILGFTDQVLLNKQVLILGRVGEYCGCAHLTEERCWVSDNALYSREIKRQVNLEFIRNYFEHLNFNQYSNKMGQPLITQGIIEKVKFGLPTETEQNEIANIFTTVDSKIEFHQKKFYLLKDLFKTLLHQLLTAQIRVHEIELGENV